MNSLCSRFRPYGSRRSVLVCVVAMLGTSAVPSLAVAAKRKAVKLDRVAIVADELAPMLALAEVLEQHAIKATIVDQTSFRDLDLGTVDAAFMYVHKPLLDDVMQALIRYTQAGGRLIVLHHGLASAKMKNPQWLEFLGVRINPRDHNTKPWLVYAHTQHVVINLRPDHYVTSHRVQYKQTVPVSFKTASNRSARFLQFDSKVFAPWLGRQEDFPAFTLEGTEIFVNQEFTNRTEKTVLLGVKLRDPVTGRTTLQPSGWFTTAGKGLLFYFQPGHQANDFRHAGFAQILINALEWQPE